MDTPPHGLWDENILDYKSNTQINSYHFEPVLNHEKMYDEESNTDSDNQEHCQQHSETAVTVQDYDDDKLYIQCFISGLKESSVKCPFDKILHSKHVRANHRFTTLICDFVKLMTEIHVLISELISEAIWGSITIGYDLIRWDGQINKKKRRGSLLLYKWLCKI